MKLTTAVKKGLLSMALLLGSLLLLVLALWKFDIGDRNIEFIAHCNKWEMCGAFLLISMSMPFVALRWRALFPNDEDKKQKQKASFIYMTGILSVAFVCNLALPGPVGEVVSASMVHKKYDISMPISFSTLILSRIIGLSSACAISGLVFLIAPFEISQDWRDALFVTALMLVFCSGGLIWVAYRPIFWRRVVQKIPHPKFLQKIWDFADVTFQTLQKTLLVGKRAYIESLFWALMGHVMVSIGIFLACSSIGVSVDFSAILFTYAASVAASVAMFMLPGSGLGWDVLFATTLSNTGSIDMMSAGVVTLVVRFQQLFVAIVGVVFVWFASKSFIDSLSIDMKEHPNN
jgi:hypothetical protein